MNDVVCMHILKSKREIASHADAVYPGYGYVPLLQLLVHIPASNKFHNDEDA